MNERKTATMLAALRYWQAMEMPRLVEEEGNEARDAAAPFRDYFEDEKPLTSEEIDSLCEEINCGPEIPSGIPALRRISELTEQQGWNSSSVAMLAERFIGLSGDVLMDRYASFLEEVAEEENSTGEVDAKD